MSEGSRRQLVYVAETEWGTTPSTPDMKTLRNTGGSGIRVVRSSIESGEFRSDRAIPSLRLGTKQGQMTVPFELSFGSQDDMIEAAFFSSLAVAYNLTSLTIDVDSGAKTFTRSSGSWITDGVKVGDKVTFDGFTNTENNDTFVASDVTATVITCATATGLVTESGTGDESATTTRKIMKSGVTSKFFTFEEGFVDIAKYQVMKGCMVNSLNLNAPFNGIVTGELAFLAKEVAAMSGTPLDASPDPAPTTDPMDSFIGSMKEAGAATSVVTDFSMSLANGLEALFPLFTQSAYRMGVGRCRITGRVSVFFEDETMLNKFINETESSLEITMTDLAGNSYRLTLPRIKYTDAEKNLTENNIILAMPFSALYDSTEDCTAIWEYIPA